MARGFAISAAIGGLLLLRVCPCVTILIPGSVSGSASRTEGEIESGCSGWPDSDSQIFAGTRVASKASNMYDGPVEAEPAHVTWD
eukprot:960418-Rhodomonas_salina.1